MDMPGAAERAPVRHDGPATDPSAMSGLRSGLRQGFWRSVRLWTALGVVGWLVLTCGVVWLARDLDRWTIAQVPAGYWWAAQGAIGGFLVIIVVYCIVMERLEAQFVNLGGDDEPSSGFPSGVAPLAEPGSGPKHG
ncbi:DUF4212 domain-containing protein [Sphaerotilus microaerophilus]|jgi:putative solute:sodium symporter small subunit|uniref:Sodium symporter small subunit domain-containing protein n=1 Tax=Sphaerotilus microaerophilus TaxID=2914710 RepID=A0ABM7YQ94_9BURK|nr:DUF4212 domain-containing protein [Sphaerotilus sp. FB-5]BDI06682.1 hypothetical protein CATMQ487_36520 [Sphaerotilus sp. FB-5]